MEIYKMRPFPGDRSQMVPRLEEILLENKYADEKDLQVGPRISMHAKTLVVDSRIVLIGSHNFDPRSFDINSECGFLVEDTGFAHEVKANISSHLHPHNSWVVGRRLQNDRIANKVTRPIGTLFMHLPVMDIWPHNYTSVFELKEGGEIHSPFDNEFHNHYRDVNLFPEVNSLHNYLIIRSIRILGGWSRPLM